MYIQNLVVLYVQGASSSNSPKSTRSIWRGSCERRASHAASATEASAAGEVEPRILELLPALIVKRPALFESTANLPADLASVVAALRRDRVPAEFRGISGKDVHRWLARVGQRGKVPARLKSFRFTPADQRLLEELATSMGISETEVIRRGLRALS